MSREEHTKVSVEESEKNHFHPSEILSANQLLERKCDESYIEEWSKLLEEHRDVNVKRDDTSIVIFRLGHEWLGVKTGICSAILGVRPIQKIPHRKNKLLQGLINYQGQLKICINLHHLLDLAQTESVEKKRGPLLYQRMLAVQMGEEFWVFPVDEVLGIVQFDSRKMENVPVTVLKSSVNYIKGVVTFSAMTIGVIDEELLFYSIKKRLA